MSEIKDYYFGDSGLIAPASISRSPSFPFSLSNSLSRSLPFLSGQPSTTSSTTNSSSSSSPARGSPSLFGNTDHASTSSSYSSVATTLGSVHPLSLSDLAAGSSSSSSLSSSTNPSPSASPQMSPLSSSFTLPPAVSSTPAAATALLSRTKSSSHRRVHFQAISALSGYAHRGLI